MLKYKSKNNKSKSSKKYRMTMIINNDNKHISILNEIQSSIYKPIDILKNLLEESKRAMKYKTKNTPPLNLS